MSTADSPLAGFTVGVTADRRAEEQALMFTRLGAEVVLGSAMGTRLVTDEGPLKQVTDALIAHPPDYLVADTGIGIRSWMAAAAGWGVDAALVSALRSTRIAARGPKATGALRSAGLDVWWRAPSEQLSEVVARLLAEDLAGRVVALQLHGEDDDATPAAFEGAGARTVPLTVYRWTAASDDAPAIRLIDGVCRGDIDAVTFTSAPAVHNLMALADGLGRGEEVLDALNGATVVGCVGPVCAAAAVAEGITGTVIPEHWRLGSLVRVVADALVARTAVNGG